MGFYTNCQVRNNRILLRGYQNGRRFQEKTEYRPRLFVPTKNETKFRTIEGLPVDELRFDSPRDLRDFRKKYENVEGFDYYGLEHSHYAYLYENYAKCSFVQSDIVECIIDIETDTEGGYADIDLADKTITAITMLYDDITFALGYGDFETDDDNIKYIKCDNEHQLLRRFIKIWSQGRFSPDVVSGWNIEFFDIPYLVNRIARLLGDDFAKQLSPWGILESRQIEVYGKMKTIYLPVGIAVLDYIKLYKKFVLIPQESYKLDSIAEFELGVKKLDYSEYGSLHKLYVENHQKFMEYNILDCQLVKQIDQKRNLFALVYNISYDAGVNYTDALGTVKSWDVAIHNYLMDRCIVIPQVKQSGNKRTFLEGGYVKPPLVGMHNWVVSFDLTSLYPFLIQQYNIGPDTFVKELPEIFTAEDIINNKHRKYDDWLEENNYCLSGSSAVYDKSKPSFLSVLMKEMFDSRSNIKKQMIVLKQEKQETGNAKLDNEISRLDTLQHSLKIRLNSAYGALSNKYFRWFDIRNASAITLSGQLTVKWAEHYLNQFMNNHLGTVDIDYVIAVDTDSVYVNMEGIADSFWSKGVTPTKLAGRLDDFCEKRIQPFLNKIFDELKETMHAKEQGMFMKREAIADRGVFTAKKRYMLNVLNNEGVQYKEPELKVMGLESVRSSTPTACRIAIKEVIRKILQEDEAHVQEYIKNFRVKFNELPFDQIAKNSSVNGLEKYFDSTTLFKKGTPIHVRGALAYNYFREENDLTNELEEIFEGEKIKYCYLVLPNPIRQNVIAVPSKLLPELGLDQYIDRDEQFSKTFLEPVQTILEKIKWTSEPTINLKKFFKKAK